MSNGTNPTSELLGLQVAITNAVAGAITRSVTVLNRDYDGFYEGTYPLIVLRLADFNLQVIAGGGLGIKGQQSTAQNYYAIEIRDVIDPRAEAGSRVANSQNDIYALIGAICDWFDTLSHSYLPDGGGINTAYKAGGHIRFRMARPFTSEDGGEVNVVVAGLIGVIGFARQGIDA